MTLPDVIAGNIRARRALLRLRQADVAAALHTDVRTISRIETGEREIRVGELPTLCEVLECDLRTLAQGADPADLRRLGLS